MPIPVATIITPTFQRAKDLWRVLEAVRLQSSRAGSRLPFLLGMMFASPTIMSTGRKSRPATAANHT